MMELIANLKGNDVRIILVSNPGVWIHMSYELIKGNCKPLNFDKALNFHISQGLGD